MTTETIPDLLAPSEDDRLTDEIIASQYAQEAAQLGFHAIYGKMSWEDADFFAVIIPDDEYHHLAALPYCDQQVGDSRKLTW